MAAGLTDQFTTQFPQALIQLAGIPSWITFAQLCHQDELGTKCFGNGSARVFQRFQMGFRGILEVKNSLVLG